MNFCTIRKKAAGHNSALIDEDGAHYLVHHQRFNISPQTEEHELRLHQQFMNEEQWPVTAVYEYSKEQISHYDEAKVIGTYEFINHGTDSSGEMLITQSVNLNEDGTISGMLQAHGQNQEQLTKQETTRAMIILP